VWLTVHLFASEVRRFDQLVNREWSDHIQPVVQNRLEDLDFEARLIEHRSHERLPEYYEYLSDYFSIGATPVGSYSVAVLVEVERRFFAITFGYGRGLLTRSLLVHDFGIRVTANSIDSETVQAVETRTLSAIGRQTYQRVAIASGLREFSVDLDSEWVRSLAGATDDDFARGLSGSQSLRLRLNDGHAQFHQLGAILRELLRRYESAAYCESFPFLDYLRPLPQRDLLVKKLDQTIVSRLQMGAENYWRGIGIILPDLAPQVMEGGVRGYRVRSVPSHHDELDIRLAREAVRRSRRAEPLKAEIEVLNQQLQVVDRWTVRECLSVEIQYRDRYFVLAAGSWFEVRANRLAEINKKVARIPTLNPSDVDLPCWSSSDDETEYNKSAAEGSGGRFRLIHIKSGLYYAPGERGGVELCDLMDDRLHLVCVKKLKRSNELSHLFAQGSVSADLYASDRDFRRRVEYEFQSSWPDREVPPVPTIIYAIATEREGELKDLIPFFSKINLITHAERIRESSRLDVALLKIEITRPDLSARIPIPRLDGEQASLFDDTTH
jgi:uncharacterized protein (TIGR04141 family)